MNYLQLVNGVLVRLREPEVASVVQSTDYVVNLAKAFVNDAKRHVEMAHSWNATRNLWQFSTVIGQPNYILEDTAGGARISVVTLDGWHVHQWDLKAVLHINQGVPNLPFQWAFDGTDNKGDLSIRFGPIPDKVYQIQVLGHKVLPDFVNDIDESRLPAQPILYYALALAARERGEVGGQTATELFSMAQQYISDAIALDANLSPTEKLAVTV